jgi:hypothetical protein
MFGGLLGLGIGSGIGISLGYALNSSRQQRYVSRSRLRRVALAIVAGMISGILGIGYYATIVFQQLSFTGSLVESAIFGLIWAYVVGALFAILLVRRRHPSQGDFRPSIDVGGIFIGPVAIFTIVLFAITGYWMAFGPDLGSIVAFIVGGAIVSFAASLFLAAIQRIEWGIAHLPARTLGYLGLAFVVLGFLIQTVQYLVPLLDISIS